MSGRFRVPRRPSTLLPRMIKTPRSGAGVSPPAIPRASSDERIGHTNRVFAFQHIQDRACAPTPLSAEPGCTALLRLIETFSDPFRSDFVLLRPFFAREPPASGKPCLLLRMGALRLAQTEELSRGHRRRSGRLEPGEVEFVHDIEVELGLIERASGFDRRRPGRQADRPRNARNRVLLSDERDELETSTRTRRAGKSVEPESPCGQPDTASKLKLKHASQ